LGKAFALEVERMVLAIREHPDLGSPLGAKTRRVLVHRFPYSLIYHHHVDQFEVADANARS
ncbi:MAG: hypothetical protein ACMG6H_16050, partial [Acidobacteriota bacterium]